METEIPKEIKDLAYKIDKKIPLNEFETNLLTFITIKIVMKTLKDYEQTKRNSI